MRARNTSQTPEAPEHADGERNHDFHQRAPVPVCVVTANAGMRRLRIDWCAKSDKIEQGRADDHREKHRASNKIALGMWDRTDQRQIASARYE